MASVAQSRELTFEDARFSSSLKEISSRALEGVAETFDAFVPGGQVRFNVQVGISPCPSQFRQAIFFALSPQSTDHPVWSQLKLIREGFHCKEALPKN